MKSSTSTGIMSCAVAMIFLQLIASILPIVEARPNQGYDPIFLASIQGCISKPEVEELCQQCAKHTKSNIVYPMCCEDTEAARAFCRRYLDYGLH